MELHERSYRIVQGERNNGRQKWQRDRWPDRSAKGATRTSRQVRNGFAPHCVLREILKSGTAWEPPSCGGSREKESPFADRASGPPASIGRATTSSRLDHMLRRGQVARPQTRQQGFGTSALEILREPLCKLPRAGRWMESQEWEGCVLPS